MFQQFFSQNGMKPLITIFLLTLVIATEAQISKKGYFQVNATSACSPFDLVIINTNLKTSGECTDNKPCLMSFEREPVASGSQNTFTHTYTKTGTFTVSVGYQSIGEDKIEITVKDNIAPTLKVRPCSPTEIKLEISSAAAYDRYNIVFDSDPTTTQNASSPDAKANVTKLFATPNAAHTVNVSGVYNGAIENCQTSSLIFTLQEPPLPFIETLNSQLPDAISFKLTQVAQVDYSVEGSTNSSTGFTTLMNNFQGDTYNTKSDIKSNYYCYRILTHNPCTNTDIYSNTICTQKFSIETLDDRNRLNWETSPTNIENYQVTETSRTLNGNGIVLPPAKSFDDFTVVSEGCKKLSTYQLTSRYTNGSLSTSKLENIQPKLIQRLPPVANTSTIAGGNSVTITWALADPAGNEVPSVFTINRSVRGGPYGPIATPNPANPWTYVDTNYKPESPTCYQILYSDNCGNVSAVSPTACVIQPAITETKEELLINWNNYTGFSNLTKYRLVKADETGKTIEEKNTGTAASYSETRIDKNYSTRKYYVLADPDVNAGVPSAQSDMLLYKSTSIVLFPNAFTPNGDRVNDTFYAQGLYITKVIFYVYDRWGTIVYATDNNEPWDGTRNGTILPPAVYTWRAEVWDAEGRSKKHSGIVYMLNERTQ